MDQPANKTTPLLACPSCSQEMLSDDDGTLPLHEAGARQCQGSYSVGQPSRGGQMIRPPYVPEEIDRKAALEMLNSRQCWHCGGPKRRGNAFCKAGFLSVKPIQLRLSLYLNVGDGFEQAFAESLEYLRREYMATEQAKGCLIFEAAGRNVNRPPDSRV
jgi:hypothetical protein